MKGAFRFPLVKIVDEGGGGENPDPSIYCPAHGYLPPYEYFESPIEVPVVSQESIVFILDKEQNPFFKNITVISSPASPKKFVFYDDQDNLLGEQITASGTTYVIDQTIPASPSQYVKCVLSLTIGGAVFTNFYTAVSSGYVFGIVAIYANTPSLIGTVNFRSHKSLKILEFLCDLNSVTSFESLLRSTGVERFTMPVNMNSLISLWYAAVDSETIQFTFPPNFSASSLSGMFAFAQTALKLEQIVIPSIPSLRGLNLLAYLCPSLKQITIQDGTYIEDIKQMLEGTGIEVLTLPSMPYSFLDIITACKNMKKLKKATFEGTWGAWRYNMLNGCSSLVELHMPRTLNSYGYNTDSTLQAVQTLHVPDFINANASSHVYNYQYLIGLAGTTVQNSLKKVYGDCEFATGEQILVFSANYREKLQEINLPKLRVSQILLGNSVATKYTNLSTLVVDWSNSLYSSITTPQIAIAANLSAEKLNEIATLLPTVTGKTMDVRYCTGYSGFNKSIATAKGWTVL